MSADALGQGGMTMPAQRLPPIDLAAIGSLMLIVIGGIYMASYIPRTPPLAVPIVLLVLAGALLAWNAFALNRSRHFHRDRFLLVGKWALLAYVIEAGFLEYVFVVDGVRGRLLVVLSLMLLVFAIDIPLIIAFSVVKYTGVNGQPQAGPHPQPLS